MKSVKVLGVVAIVGTMFAADVHAARGGGGGGGARIGGGGGGGFARAQAPAFRGGGFGGGRAFAQPRFAGSQFSGAAMRPVGFRSGGAYMQPVRGIYRGGYARPVAMRQAAFRARPAYAYARPVRGVYRGGYARRAAFRRGAFVQPRRLVALQRVNWRRNVDWRDRRHDHRRRVAFLPYFYGNYYYPTNYYSDYYSDYYPATYSTAAVAPVATYAVTGSSTVLSVQTRLARLGYYNGPLDGIMGPRTRTAIVLFERDRGLPRYTRITSPLLVSLGLA